MRLLFRVDDILLDDSNFEFQLLQIFQKANIPIMLGVIPIHTTESHADKYVLSDSLKQILNSKLFTIAMHGYRHRKNGHWGEFYGLDREKQLNWIIKGKQKLEKLLGIRVWSFIPPWNAFDIQTISCLREAEFELISYGHDKRTNDITDNNLNLLKYSVEHLYFLKSYTFMFMLFMSKFGCYKEVTILILFHPYNFEDWLNKKYYKGKKERFNTKLAHLQQDLMRLKKNPNVVFSEITAKTRYVEYKSFILKFLYRIETRRQLFLLTDH
jgi:hypothetical protein